MVYASDKRTYYFNLQNKKMTIRIHKIYIFRVVLTILVFNLFLVIVVLGLKLFELNRGKVKGAQYITKINKNDISFSNQKNGLKYFYEPKPNNIEDWTRDWLDYEVKNTINSDSLNERYDYSVVKDKNTFRIITLGDSFTFGQYADTKDNYSEILEDLLNKNKPCKEIKRFEVINLGVYGYDIEYEVERFKKRGVKYDPDLLIWLISQGNFQKINEKALPLEKQLIEQGVTGFDQNTKRYTPLVEAIDRSSKDLGKQFIFDYQAERFYLMKSIYQNKLLILNHNHIHENVRELIKIFISLNLNYSFFENLFPYLDDNGFKLADNHPNRKGHKKMAYDLYSYLIKNVLTSYK